MKVSDGKSNTGAFAGALVSASSIRRFQQDVMKNLQEQESELADPAWRRKFRTDFPFWKLLSHEQQNHLRQIFAHVLPDPDVSTESFDQEERLMLDVLAETYMKQAMPFAELVESQAYQIYTRLPRDYPCRIPGLTLSASLFFFEEPDDFGKRQYTYRNIYGNETIPDTGRCRIKGAFTANQRIETLEFRTSPVQLLATHKPGEERKSGFAEESRQFHKTFVSTFLPIPVKARETFTGFIDDVTTSHEDTGDGEQPTDDDSREPEKPEPDEPEK